MKKMLILSGVLVTAFAATTYLAKARDFGSSFGGSFLGGTTGSIIGTQIAKGSSGDSRGKDALRAVERLEDATRRDLQALEKRLDDIQRQLERLADK